MKKPKRQTYFSRNGQGTQRAGSARGEVYIFAFCSPHRVSLSGLPLSSLRRAGVSEDSARKIRAQFRETLIRGAAERRKPRGSQGFTEESGDLVRAKATTKKAN
jgi:hypothetical protein